MEAHPLDNPLILICGPSRSPIAIQPLLVRALRLRFCVITRLRVFFRIRHIANVAAPAPRARAPPRATSSSHQPLTSDLFLVTGDSSLAATLTIGCVAP